MATMRRECWVTARRPPDQSRALLIHCENDAARDFYLRLAKFDASPTDPLHLFLLMKDLRKVLEST
jgi:hypothetical protein